MTGSELEDLIEQDKRLDSIVPKKAKDDEDLADWICEELKIKKPERQARQRMDDHEDEDKLAEMRRRRERD